MSIAKRCTIEYEDGSCIAKEENIGTLIKVIYYIDKCDSISRVDISNCKKEQPCCENCVPSSYRSQVDCCGDRLLYYGDYICGGLILNATYSLQIQPIGSPYVVGSFAYCYTYEDCVESIIPSWLEDFNGITLSPSNGDVYWVDDYSICNHQFTNLFIISSSNPNYDPLYNCNFKRASLSASIDCSSYSFSLSLGYSATTLDCDSLVNCDGNYYTPLNSCVENPGEPLTGVSDDWSDIQLSGKFACQCGPFSYVVQNVRGTLSATLPSYPFSILMTIQSISAPTFADCYEDLITKAISDARSRMPIVLTAGTTCDGCSFRSQLFPIPGYRNTFYYFVGEVGSSYTSVILWITIRDDPLNRKVCCAGIYSLWYWLDLEVMRCEVSIPCYNGLLPNTLTGKCIFSDSDSCNAPPAYLNTTSGGSISVTIG